MSTGKAPYAARKKIYLGGHNLFSFFNIWNKVGGGRGRVEGNCNDENRKLEGRGLSTEDERRLAIGEMSFMRHRSRDSDKGGLVSRGII